MKEAKILYSLRHPSVIMYIDSFTGEKSGLFNLVLEYASGANV